MIPSFPSSENLRPNPNTNHLAYVNIIFHDNRYRLRSLQYLKSVASIELWQMFWSVASVCMAILLLYQYELFSNNLVFFGWALIGTLLMLAYGIRNIRYTGKMLLFSICSLCCYFIACLACCLITTNKLIFATVFYIAAQFTGSLALLQNRSSIMGKIIILLQLSMIILRLDHKLNYQWPVILFGFILVLFLSFFFLLSVGLYLIIDVCFFDKPINTLKNIGIIYISINIILFFLMSITVLSGSFLFRHKLVPTIISLIFMSFLHFYSIVFKNQIALFMCKREKLKASNQSISLMQIPQHQMQQYVFVKKSDNWYKRLSVQQFKHSKIAQKQQQHKQQIAIFEDKCLVCLVQQPNVIWMPCGHLCVCMNCADRIFESKKCFCILCKAFPKTIHLVIQIKGQQPVNFQVSQQIDKESVQIINFQKQEQLNIEQQITRNDKNNRSLAQVLYPIKAYSVKIY